MAGDDSKNFARIIRCPDEEIDLLRAGLAIAAGDYPGLDVDFYLARVDQIASAVRARRGDKFNPYRSIASINFVLFQEQGFRGNRDDYYDPRNSFLNEVLERKKGIPITLSVLYMEVARRVGLELYGVGFPGHFLVKYLGDGEEIVIDPFHEGAIKTDEELEALLSELYRSEVALNPQFLQPVTKKQILERMLNNLKAIYLRREDWQRSLSVADYLVVLNPDSAGDRRDRGLLYLKLECFSSAVEDLEAYLRMAPDAEDAVAIREQIVFLKRRASQIH